MYIAFYSWHIVGCVTGKDDEIRTVKNGAMKVFNFELTDDQGKCIRIVAFNSEAEKYYAIVQDNMVYLRFFHYITTENYT